MKWGISKLALRGTQTKAISQSASYATLHTSKPWNSCFGWAVEYFQFPQLNEVAGNNRLQGNILSSFLAVLDYGKTCGMPAFEQRSSTVSKVILATNINLTSFSFNISNIQYDCCWLFIVSQTAIYIIHCKCICVLCQNVHTIL